MCIRISRLGTFNAKVCRPISPYSQRFRPSPISTLATAVASMASDVPMTDPTVMGDRETERREIPLCAQGIWRLGFAHKDRVSGNVSWCFLSPIYHLKLFGANTFMGNRREFKRGYIVADKFIRLESRRTACLSRNTRSFRRVSRAQFHI